MFKPDHILYFRKKRIPNQSMQKMDQKIQMLKQRKRKRMARKTRRRKQRREKWGQSLQSQWCWMTSSGTLRWGLQYTCTVHITGFCPDLRRGGLQGDGRWPGRGQGGQGERGGRHSNPQVSTERYSTHNCIWFCSFHKNFKILFSKAWLTWLKTHWIEELLFR